MVPEGWVIKKLGDLITSSAFGPRFSSDLYSRGGAIGTIRTTDLSITGHIEYSTIPYANLNPNLYKDHILNDGDLLITRSGTCGIACIFRRQSKPIVAGAFLIRFQLKNNIDNTYLHALLMSPTVQSRIARMAAGGVQKNLTGTSLRKLNVLSPPLLEQRKIAKILQTWDRAISTREKLIAANKQQKKALMQQLLTGKKRFGGFEGEWEENRLEKHIDFLSGFAFKSSEFEKNTEYKLLRGINISRGHLRWSVENTFTWTDAKDFIRYQLEVDDIVISMDGSLVGRNYALVTSKNIEKMLLVQRVARLRCKKTLAPEYLIQQISSAKFTAYVDAVKTVTAIPHISAKDIKNFEIPIPTKAEQQKISAVLANTDKEIETLRKNLAYLKQEKKALMQQLLTGKRRVKVDE